MTNEYSRAHKLRADLVLVFKDEKTARSVNSALAPDNVRIPDEMKIIEEQNGERVHITIELIANKSSTPFETLISTLDEFVTHVGAVIQTIDRVQSMRKTAI